MYRLARRGKAPTRRTGDSSPWQSFSHPFVFAQPVAPFRVSLIAHQSAVANNGRRKRFDKRRAQIHHFLDSNFIVSGVDAAKHVVIVAAVSGFAKQPQVLLAIAGIARRPQPVIGHSATTGASVILSLRLLG